MVMFVQVRNVNPIGAVSAVLDGDPVTVPAAHVVSVTPETAGTAPRWRRVRVDDTGQPAEPLAGFHTRQHAGHLELWDLGSGLLAQPANWIPADADPAGPRPDPLASALPVDSGTTGTENS